MQAVYYSLQVVICTAILYAYYLLALKNKQFHQYNRFFLLGILMISWLVPLMRIPVRPEKITGEQPVAAFRFFEVIADNNTHIEAYLGRQTTSFNWNIIAMYGYFSVSIVLMLIFIAGIIRIGILLRKNSWRNLDEATLVTTTAKGTPFSFFRFIFWNNEIDIASNVGKQILSHELVHVKEKHSIDKIISALVLCVGWINPIFWLVKRELNMVHEFIADKKAVNEDASELANMLLTTSFPATNFQLINSFFHSPVKRRLAMITKFNPAKHPYLRRLLILPLLGIIIMLFAFRKEVAGLVKADSPRVENVVLTNASEATEEAIASDQPAKTEITNVRLEKELSRVYNVMLDAGHGGHDVGAEANDGTKESEISLEIVNTLLEENKNEKVKLILTRAADIYQHPTVKVDLTKKNNADVLVSIHAASSANKNQNGIELFIPTKDTLKHYKESYLFANLLANTITSGELQKAKVQIKKRQVGIWVINAADRPAVLIEAGFLSNAADLKKMKDKNYQRQFARAILKGIEMYLQRLDVQQ